MRTENKNNISFIIPSFNCEKTLEEAVDSIFNNNFIDGDEVIIVNDASTDNTLEVSEKLSKNYYPNISIITNPNNLGCPATRNVGIKEAKNSLIFNLDSDNILAPYSINKLKEELIKQSADVSSFREYHYFKTNPKEITHRWLCKAGIITLEDFLCGLINPGPGGNFLYTKEIWEKVGGYWEYGKGLHEAWGFALKLLLNDAKFISIPNTYYFHRYSHESLFVRENNKENEEMLVTNKFIEHAKGVLSKESLDFIEKNRDWFKKLQNNSLALRNRNAGTNGKVVYTSFIKNLIKKCVKLLKK